MYYSLLLSMNAATAATLDLRSVGLHDASVGEATARSFQKGLDSVALGGVTVQQAQHGGLEDAQRLQQRTCCLWILPGGWGLAQNHVHRLHHTHTRYSHHTLIHRSGEIA